jgi:hypothetical protein
MELTEIRELMNRIGPDNLNIDEVEESEGGKWAIGLANGVVIFADWAPNPSRLVFSTLIGRPNVDRRYVVFESLLTFNSLWEDNPGAKMAANGPEGEVIFLFDWFADNPTLADLNDLLTQFVEYADLWCQYVTSEPETTMSAPSPMMLMTMLA